MVTTTKKIRYENSLACVQQGYPGLSDAHCKSVITDVLDHLFTRHADIEFTTVTDESWDVLILSAPITYNGVVYTSGGQQGKHVMNLPNGYYGGTNTLWNPYPRGYDDFARTFGHEMGHCLFSAGTENTKDVTSLMRFPYDWPYGLPACTMNTDDVRSLVALYTAQPSPRTYISISDTNAMWVNATGISSRDRGANYENLKRSFVFASDATLVISGLSASTDYAVAVLVGDADYYHDRMKLSMVDASYNDLVVDGFTKTFTFENVNRGEWYWWLFAEVPSTSDGKLRVRMRDLGGGDLNSVICAVDVIGVSNKKYDCGVYDTGSAAPTVISQSDGAIYHCCGTACPSDGTAGYGTGCIFAHTDGNASTALYANRGSSTSCDFDAVAYA